MNDLLRVFKELVGAEHGQDFSLKPRPSVSRTPRGQPHQTLCSESGLSWKTFTFDPINATKLLVSKLGAQLVKRLSWVQNKDGSTTHARCVLDGFRVLHVY